MKMNMQDYRHAADRVEISEHCREEILSMTKKNEQKTGAPILRITAGITAAAACLGIAGTVGYAMLRMKAEESSLAAASPAAEQLAVDYRGIFNDYYAHGAAQPADVDYSLVTGTTLNETWETDDCTVTLNAAISDGWTINYIYYVKMKNGQRINADGTDTNGKMIPFLQIYSDVPEAGLMQRAGSQATSYVIRLDAQPDENGIIRCFGTCRCAYALPLPQGVAYHASCDGIEKDITVNLPENVPAGSPLVTLDAEGNATQNNAELPLGLEKEVQMSYSVVTPLGVILSNYRPDPTNIKEQDGLVCRWMTEDQMPAVSNGDVLPTFAAQSPTVSACEWAPGGECCAYAAPLDTESQWDSCVTCWLPFALPQNFGDTRYLTVTNPAQDISAAAAVNSLKYETQTVENSEIPDVEPDCLPDPDAYFLAGGTYARLNEMTMQERTKELPIGTVTLEDIVYLTNGHPALNMTVLLNDTVGAEVGDQIAVCFTPVAFGAQDEDRYSYKMSDDEAPELDTPAGAKWAYGDVTKDAAEKGIQVQLELNPLEPGAYPGENYWEYLDVELKLDQVMIRKPASGAYNYAWTAADEDATWQFKFGFAAYLPFEKLDETHRTRTLENGAMIRVDSVEYEDGVPVISYSVNLGSTELPASDCYLICQPLTLGLADDEVYVFNADSEHGSKIVATTGEMQNGWYRFSQKLVPQERDYPTGQEMIVDMRLCLMVIGPDGAQNQIDLLELDSPSAKEEGGMIHICRFII